MSEIFPDSSLADYQSEKILREHTGLLDGDEYAGYKALSVDALDEHTRHIAEHTRFLSERKSDIRIQDRSGLLGHIKVHKIMGRETDLIGRRRLARELANELSLEIFD